jgi:hypothetical protein
MTITFQHPLNTNSLRDFEPSNREHYSDSNGIYIYGLRLKINRTLKFVPIYVGIAYDDTLRNRLFKHHYNKYSNCAAGSGKGIKDLWDFSSVSSLNDLIDIYSEMHHYDYINNYRKGMDRTSAHYLRELLNLRYLLFFQNRNFFTMKAGGVFAELNKKTRELNHCDAITGGYDTRGKIAETKNIYTDNFYYVYCSYEEIEQQLDRNGAFFSTYPTPKEQLERIERATKRALNIIGIHTTAKAGGPFVDMDIDLSPIQNQLVNVGGHPYNVGGNYSNLIIPIRK